jgi:hypothetical protein
MKWRKMLCLGLMTLAVIFVANTALGDFRIVVAKWHADKQQLSVMGVRDEGGVVSISVVDPDTGETLGYTSTDACGVWKMKIRTDSVPENIIAVSNEEMSLIRPVYLDP